MDTKDVVKGDNHPLHIKIGKLIMLHFPNCESSRECDGGHYIPLYCSDENRDATKYCMVDLLIPKDEKIKVIIEIEKSNIKPIQIFGKVFASALSSYYIYDSKKYKMDDTVKFIQILYASELKKESSKLEQFNNIQKSIQNVIPRFSKIKNYEIICVTNNLESDADTKNKIINSIREGLK